MSWKDFFDLASSMDHEGDPEDVDHVQRMQQLLRTLDTPPSLCQVLSFLDKGYAPTHITQRVMDTLPSSYYSTDSIIEKVIQSERWSPDVLKHVIAKGGRVTDLSVKEAIRDFKFHEAMKTTNRKLNVLIESGYVPTDWRAIEALTKDSTELRTLIREWRKSVDPVFFVHKGRTQPTKDD